MPKVKDYLKSRYKIFDGNHETNTYWKFSFEGYIDHVYKEYYISYCHVLGIQALPLTSWLQQEVMLNSDQLSILEP